MPYLTGLILPIAALLTAALSAQTSGDSALLSDLSAHHYAEAVALADKTLQTRPNDPWLLTVRGMALDGMDNASASLASYDRALRFKPDYLPALKGAAQLTYRRHDARASSYLRRLLALDPGETAAHAMMGVLEFEAHNCTAAIAQFQASAGVVVSREASATEYASCLMESKRTGDAITVLKQARGYFPSSRNLRYDLGLAQEQNGDSASALETLTPAPDDDPGILNLRASVEAATGNLDAAFLDLRHAVEMNPKEPRNYVDMALLCLDHDQDQRAADVMTVGIEQLPENASFYAIRGIAYAELSKFDDAGKDFTRSAELDPRSAFGQLAHNILYVERSQPEKAKEALQNQARERPGDPVANILLADLLLQQGATPGKSEWEDAKAAIARALKVKPDSVDALNLQGQIDFEENRLDAASAILERARQLDPDNPTTLNRLLIVDKRLGREQEAKNVANRLKSLLSAAARRDQDGMRTSAAR